MNCHRLPSLPGLSFEERLRRNNHVSQCFFYRNGYRMDRIPAVGIGKEPIRGTYKDFHTEAVEYDPELTYGRAKKQQVEPFRPHYVIYDKKTLKFIGYFRQHVPESRIEHYRVRYVNIFYYLEDDTLEVYEPLVKNCGLYPQGRLLRRGKIAKNASAGIFYTWKDFNIGIDIELGGIIYHIADCDPYTREFLTANGVEVSDKECMPQDPVTVEKMLQQAKHHQNRQKEKKDDKLKRFLEYFGMVLSFDCVLDETERPGGEMITFKLYYYLEDDTIAIKELPENQQGRDGFPLLLKRTKVPKNWQKKPADFASIVFEATESEYDEFYDLHDFIVGNTIFVFGRKFLLLDCDKFTREYYDKVLRCPQSSKLHIEKPELPEIKIKLPEYLGIGTAEDSLASCFHLTPKEPKKDMITYLMNANRILRYGCILDTAHPEDKGRRFIMTYSLADGNISLMELSSPGLVAGKFLSSRKVPKPQSNPNKPEYYTPKDFAIGTIIYIYSHRFIITSADLYVYSYMQAHPEKFSPQIIESVRMYNLKEGNLKGDVRKAIEDEQRRYFEATVTVDEEQKLISEPIGGERIPKPFIQEDEVKKFYHDQEEKTPGYMKEKCQLPCDINIKEEKNIPSDKHVVKFLEPHEEINY